MTDYRVNLTLDEFVVRKTEELKRFADWYRKQQDRTKEEDYPTVQALGDWEDQFANFAPDLS